MIKETKTRFEFHEDDINKHPFVLNQYQAMSAEFVLIAPSDGDPAELAAYPMPQTRVEDTILNPNTGEILAYVVGTDQETFEADTPEHADWVLEKIHNLDGRIAGINLELRAVTDRLGTQKRALTRNRDWLESRFGPGIEAVALEHRKDWAGKTWKRTWGKVSFKKQNDKLEVEDNDLLCEIYGDENECVKVTKTFYISKLTKEVKEKIMLDMKNHVSVDVADNRGLLFTPAGDDTMTIDTGVKT